MPMLEAPDLLHLQNPTLSAQSRQAV